MQYQVLKSCVIHGSAKRQGTILELTDEEAKELMGIGRVAPYEPPKFENRSVGLEDSEEAPKKRGRKKKIDG